VDRDQDTAPEHGLAETIRRLELLAGADAWRWSMFPQDVVRSAVYWLQRMKHLEPPVCNCGAATVTAGLYGPPEHKPECATVAFLPLPPR
jgi:hypothetical protein